MRLKAFFVMSLLCLAGCGIDGDPIAPAEKPKKVDIIPQKLSETDPMTSEGIEQVEVVPLNKINRLGSDYDSNFQAEIHDLEQMFERLKPASAQPQKQIIETLE